MPTVGQYHQLWAELHSRPHAVPSLHRAAELAWLARFASRIPCGGCRTEWTRLSLAHPPCLANRASYFRWTVSMHNLINIKLDKPLVTFAQARALFDTSGRK